MNGFSGKGESGVAATCGGMPVAQWVHGMARLAVVVSIAMLSPATRAATRTWTGAVNGAWDTTTANWVGPATFANYDDAVFDGGTSSLNATGSVALTIGSIALQNGYGGTVVLQAANTVTGSTTLAAGTIAITADNNLGASAATLSLSGGTLRTLNTGGALLFTRATTIGAGGGTLHIAGTAVSGQKSMASFNTANTLLGSGALTISGNGTLDGAGGSGALSVNTSNSYSGTITLQNGGLFEYGNAHSVDASATFMLGNTGSLAANTGVTVVNAITVNGANSILSFNNGNAGVYSGAITLATNVTVGLRDWWDGTVRNGMISGVISGTGGLVVNSGTGSGGIVAIGNVNNSFGGGMTISNAIVLAGATNWNGTATSGTGGTSAAQEQAALGTGTITVRTNGVLQMGYRESNTETAYITNSIVLNGGAVWANDAYQHLSGPVNVESGGGFFGSTYTAGTGVADKGLYIDGVLSGSGPLTLEQAGLGGNGAPAEANGWGNASGNSYNTSIVNFGNNSNTYSGTITLIPYTAGAGAGSYLAINASYALSNATVNLSGNNTGNQAFGASPLLFKTGLGSVTLGALAGSGNVILLGYNENTPSQAADAIALVVGNNDSSTTYSGVMSGAGSLTKTGAGTMTLAGTNTYTGTTTINAGGTLAIGGAGQLGSGSYAAAITNNGGFTYNSSVPQTLGGVISGSGTLTQSGPGKLTLTGSSTYSGATTVAAGTLTVNGTLVNAGGLTVNGGATLGGTGTVAGVVSLAVGTDAAARGVIDQRGGTVGEVLSLSALTLGGSSNDAASLGFDVATNAADKVAIAGVLTVNDGGAVIAIPYMVALLPGYTNILMTFASGAGSGFVTGSGAQVGGLSLADPQPSFGLSCSLIVTSTNVLLVTSGTPPPATAYWDGSQGTSWTNVGGGVANFTIDQAGTTPVGAYPSLNTDVIFAKDGASNLSGITLGQDFVIRSLAFLNNVGAVTISPDGHTVTLESGNGLAVQNGAGAISVGANIVMAAPQSWTNANSSDLTVSGTISSATNATLTIANTGSGKTVLAGANTYTGNTTVASGTIKLANRNALLNSTLLLGSSGLEFDSSVSAHAFTLGGLSGSTDLALQDNAATAIALSVGTNGSSTTYSGALSAGGSLAKAGAGTLILTATNTYAGTTTINGTLQINGAGQLGGGVYSAAITNNGALVLNSTADQTLSGVMSGTGSLTKSGTSTLTLSGANTYSGTTTVSGGTLYVPAGGVANSSGTGGGNYFSVGTVSSVNTMLRIDGGAANLITGSGNAWASYMQVGNGAGCRGFISMTAGSLTAQRHLVIGDAGGFGAMTMTGGALSVGSYFITGFGGGSGVFNQTGGTVTQTQASAVGYTLVGSGPGSLGVMTLRGGSFNATAGGIFVSENNTCTGVLNILGNAAVTAGNVGIKFANDNVAAKGILNLMGGTLTANIVQKGPGTGIVNFHGGVLKASGSSTTFMQGLTSANVYPEGAVIDDNSNTITVAQALLAPSGYGVNSIALTNSGSGYLDTPIVTITGGSGSNATAIAQIDYAGGTVTNILVTNPGNGYGSGDTLVATLSGGGGSGAGLGAVFLAANTSGGLTKLGAGSLSLAGANTYTLATVVSNGTVAVNGSLAGEVNVVSNATLAGTGTVYGAVTVANGGMVAPGLAATNYATLTIGQGTNLSGTLVINISSNGLSDRLSSMGALNLGSLALSVVETNLLTAANTNDYIIASASLVNGSFRTTNLPKGWIVTRGSGAEVHLKQGTAGFMLLVN